VIHSTVHAGLRVHILEQLAQVGFGRLLAYPQALDGTVFSVSQNPPTGATRFDSNDRGAGARPSTINSEN
jgi:hypothetical protein